ncbi:UNVERIFIED_CONTAM: hypothetical protein K2H54_055100 [Gekko kuhli]
MDFSFTFLLFGEINKVLKNSRKNNTNKCQNERKKQGDRETAISSSMMNKEFLGLLSERFITAGSQYQLIPELLAHTSDLVLAHFLTLFRYSHLQQFCTLQF